MSALEARCPHCGGPRPPLGPPPLYAFPVVEDTLEFSAKGSFRIRIWFKTSAKGPYQGVEDGIRAHLHHLNARPSKADLASWIASRQDWDVAAVQVLEENDAGLPSRGIVIYTEWP